ncbi:MAG: hypothetical protein J7576_11165 [Siphonobacter aquaeclarae]|nr:hypothetical protein [Siphonobacter aquaeclarae]
MSRIFRLVSCHASFLLGVGSVIDLTGSMYRGRGFNGILDELEGKDSDTVESSWIAVGGYLRSSMKEVEKELPASSSIKELCY